MNHLTAGPSRTLRTPSLCGARSFFYCQTAHFQTAIPPHAASAIIPPRRAVPAPLRTRPFAVPLTISPSATRSTEVRSVIGIRIKPGRAQKVARVKVPLEPPVVEAGVEGVQAKTNTPEKVVKLHGVVQTPAQPTESAKIKGKAAKTSKKKKKKKQLNPSLPPVPDDLQSQLQAGATFRPVATKEKKGGAPIDVHKEVPPHLEHDVQTGPGANAFHSKGSLKTEDIVLSEVQPNRVMKIARLRSQLSRVLFSPGVHVLQDPRTGIYNFKPEQLQAIPAPEEYAFDRGAQYTPPGKDTELTDLAEREDCKFIGSTSTLTKALSQIYFALSGGRGVDLQSLSQAFSSERTDYTFGASLPACLIIGKQQSGRYYVDNDKSYDSTTILMELGHVMEKMLTTEPDDFKRFLKSSPEDSVTEAERKEKEAYRYQRSRTLLMRSQLDCQDPRLPGNGVFDIKTRACVAIRHDPANHLASNVYDISKERGRSQSYEREYYDLIRAALLKYSLQARIGMMDGIFVAYHNTARIFGFQYLPLEEIDERLFGSTELAESAFKLSVSLLEILLAEIVQSFPEQDVKVVLKHMEPRYLRTVTAYAEPNKWDGSDNEKPIQAITLAIDSTLDGQRVHGPISFSVDEKTRKAQKWSVDWTISKTEMTPEGQDLARAGRDRALSDVLSVMSSALPEGKSKKDMKSATSQSQEADGHSNVQWKPADSRITGLRREAKESGEAYEVRKKSWKTDQGGSWEEPVRS